MKTVDFFLFLYKGDFDTCEEKARCLSWLLFNSFWGKLNKKDIYSKLKKDQIYCDHKNKIIEFYPCEKCLEPIESEVKNSLEYRGYVGMELSNYDSDVVFGGIDSIDHVFVLVKQDESVKIVHCYSCHFGVQIQNCSLFELFNLLRDPSRWNSFFGVSVKSPTSLHVGLFI